MTAHHRARQGDLFANLPSALVRADVQTSELPLLQAQLQAWQNRLAAHQGPLFASGSSPSDQPRQGDLFASDDATEQHAERLDPQRLQPQPLSFWRWPQLAVSGAALYMVLDRPARLSHPLMLYVGETARAEQRWKGEHDCKHYLAAYGETLQRLGQTPRLSIAFWSDAPEALKARRALEQALIRRWLPAFNKETRNRWATPFQTESG